jgi:hypothetical protein
MAELCLSVHNRTMSNVQRTGKWRRFLQLNAADKWLLLRAAGWLLIARVRLAVTPFRHLAESLSTGSERANVDPELLRRVSYAVTAAAANVPWRSDCFPQTIAARMLLKSFGYSSTIHLGVNREGPDELDAHAWLTCGGIVVTGAQGLDRYVEMHRLGA